jgi:hypothetical protein
MLLTPFQGCITFCNVFYNPFIRSGLIFLFQPETMSDKAFETRRDHSGGNTLFFLLLVNRDSIQQII